MGGKNREATIMRRMNIYIREDNRDLFKILRRRLKENHLSVSRFITDAATEYLTMVEMSEHNHPILEPENGELYHPSSDPRILWKTCPACEEIMRAWDLKIKQMIREGA